MTEAVDALNPTKKKRLLSLDVFRGLTIAFMILVNDPGDWGHVYTPLDHAEWNGCTPTDLVFPSFLFMVGVAIVYAMESKKKAREGHGKIILHAFRRMVTLILITWVVQFIFRIWDSKTHSVSEVLAHLRFPGVLPRIAVVYFIATVIYLKTEQKTRDWIFAGVLIAYFLIMTLVPVPGVGAANLEPSTNLGAWLDRLIFGTNHLWGESKTWDPEGILGTIPALGTALFGIRVGSWLKRADKEDATKVSWMFVYGLAAIAIGLFWNFFFPINKKLWTSSYVLYAGGIATCILAALYWIIDVQGKKWFIFPFVVFGINSIATYVMADIVPELMGKIWGGSIQKNLFNPFFSPYNASLAGAMFTVLILWAIMWVFYRFKIIIKV